MGRTLTHTHTTHLYTHTHGIPLNEAASSASALHLLCPPVSSPRSAFIKPSTHSHTLTHIAHRVHSKKKWLPPFATPAAPPFGAHYTLGLSCLKIDKLILKLYKQRLSSLSLSLHLPLSSSLYLLLFSMRLFCPLYCLFHLPLTNLFVAQIVLAFKAKQLLCCVFF